MIRAHLDESTISAALSTNYWRVRVLSEVSSTQDILKNELVSNGDCVVTEYQSAGRGRLDRKFESVPDVALLYSFYIEPTRSSQWGWIPLLAGMSVAQTLNEQTASKSFSTKWPNDVVSDSGKISGILCERFGKGIIVGTGINVTTEPADLPVPTASSIFIETGQSLDRNHLLAAALRTFAQNFALWDSGVDLNPKYRALSKTIGLDVKVLLPNGLSLEGRAIGVDGDGQLLLESGDRVSVGDVVHLR